jgi:hypothetical protein
MDTTSLFELWKLAVKSNNWPMACYIASEYDRFKIAEHYLDRIYTMLKN